MSLDMAYIQGATALINSILKNASCPQHIFFHFMVTGYSPSGTKKANSETESVDSFIEEQETYKTLSPEDDDIINGIGTHGYPDVESIINFYFPFVKYRMYHIDEDTLKTTV